MIVGAKVADYSTQWALVGTIVIFIISAAVSLLLPKKISKKAEAGSKVIRFYQQAQLFFDSLQVI